MKYIKGVHRHGSETFTIISKDKKNSNLNKIYKSASTIIGIKSIISEFNGITWYNERNQNNVLYELKKYSDYYYKIMITLNKQFYNINSNMKYLMLEKYLDLTISHYAHIWHDYKGHEFAPLHGDLSLVGNVMFNYNDEVLFVDWEHFQKDKNIPIGLDIIMILLENIWYETRRSNKIDSSVLRHFVNSLNSLNNLKLLSPLFLDNPAYNSVNFIQSNIDIWNGQHNKLPILRLSKKDIFEIDNAVSQLNN